MQNGLHTRSSRPHRSPVQHRHSRSFLASLRRSPRLLALVILVAAVSVAATAFVLLRPTNLEPATALEPASADPVRSCDATALDAAFRALDEASGYRFRSYHEVTEKGQTRTATLTGAYRAAKRMHATVTSVAGGPPYTGYVRMVRLNDRAFIVPVREGLQTWREIEGLGTEIPVRDFRGTLRAQDWLKFEDAGVGQDDGMCRLTARIVGEVGGGEEYRVVIDRESGLLVEGAMEVNDVVNRFQGHWGFTITWDIPPLEEFAAPVVVAP